MKHLSFKFIVTAFTFATVAFFAACKSKTDTGTNNTDVNKLPDTTVMTDQPASTGGPVTVSPDDSLTNTLKDATKDFPGVTATVNNGEVTLTGDITRDKLTKLMQSVNSLHPKKINNNLTIK